MKLSLTTFRLFSVVPIPERSKTECEYFSRFFFFFFCQPFFSNWDWLLRIILDSLELKNGSRRNVHFWFFIPLRYIKKKKRKTQTFFLLLYCSIKVLTSKRCDVNGLIIQNFWEFFCEYIKIKIIIMLFETGNNVLRIIWKSLKEVCNEMHLKLSKENLFFKVKFFLWKSTQFNL